MASSSKKNGFDILKVYDKEMLISISKDLWKKLYDDYLEDQEMNINKDTLIKKYQKSSKSGFGLTI